MQNANDIWSIITCTGIAVAIFLGLVTPSRRNSRFPSGRIMVPFSASFVLLWFVGAGLERAHLDLPPTLVMAIVAWGFLLPMVLYLIWEDITAFWVRVPEFGNCLSRRMHRLVATLRLDPRQLLRIQDLGHCRTCDNVYVIPWFARRWMRQCPNCSNALSPLSTAEVTAMRRDAGNYGLLNEQFEELLEEKRAFEPEGEIKARPGRH